MDGLRKKEHVNDQCLITNTWKLMEIAGDREFSGTSLFRLADLINIHP